MPATAPPAFARFLGRRASPSIPRPLTNTTLDKDTRQQLLDRYRALPRKERARLDAEAARLRSLDPKHDRRASMRVHGEDEEPARGRMRPPVETFLLRLLEDLEVPGDRVATVVSLALGRATVEVGGERRTLRLAPRLADESNEGGIAVGDRVTVADDAVRTVLKRQTWLGRADPDTGQPRAIVANVDTVVVVVSVVAPPLHPRIVDRYLIGIGRGGAEAVVAVNKIDLGDEELALLEPYRAAGIPIVPVSADAGIGLDALRERLAGKTCAFVGHSGVGKSSLVNALMPEAAQAVGEVSEGYGRGTHTTTSSSTFDLGGGTRLIDTPGIRAFGLGRLTRDELAWGFPEFADHPCRLRGCTHDHEPDCGVKEAVESGSLSEFRYETYLGLLGELA